MKQFITILIMAFAALFIATTADAAPVLQAAPEIGNVFADLPQSVMIAGGGALALGAGINAVGKDTGIDFSKITEFTQQQFEELKAKHRKAFIITVNDDGELHNFAAIRPSRSTTKALTDAALKEDANKVNDILEKNLLKLGDMELLDDGVIYTSLMEQLAQLIQPAQAFFRKG